MGVLQALCRRRPARRCLAWPNGCFSALRHAGAHDDNQRQINGLAGQVGERHAMEIDQRDDHEKNQDDGFDNEIKQLHDVSLKSAGCLHTYRKCVSVNDLRGI